MGRVDYSSSLLFSSSSILYGPVAAYSRRVVHGTSSGNLLALVLFFFFPLRFFALRLGFFHHTCGRGRKRRLLSAY